MKVGNLTNATVVLLAIGLFAASSARAAVVFQDGFGDGDRDNNGQLDNPDNSGTGLVDDALDVGVPWWRVFKTLDNQSVVVQHDAGGLGDDNALFINSIGDQAYQVANFADTTLTNSGDFIRLTFTFRFTVLQSWRDILRFGLFSSNDPGDNSSKILADQDATKTVNDLGYFGTLAAGSPSVGNQDARIARKDNLVGSVGAALFRIDATLEGEDPSLHIINDAVPHTAVLTITRSTGGKPMIKLEIDGAPDLSAQDNSTTGGRPYMTFNEVGFGNVGTTGVDPADYNLDGILVETGTSACDAIERNTVQAPLPGGATTVTVNSVLATAETVNVYSNGTLIGSATGTPPTTPATLLVTVTPLVTGAKITAKQVVGGLESCFPPSQWVIVDDCNSVAAVSVPPGLDAGQTSVTVSGVHTPATQVKVYKNGSGPPIGTAPGNATTTVVVTVPALVAGDVISATQVENGVESCIPTTGSVVRTPANVVAIDDHFNDGDRDDNGVKDDPDGSGTGVVDPGSEVSAIWYKVIPGAFTNVRVAHDVATPAGLGEDNAIFADLTDSLADADDQGILVANFPSVTLASPSDNLKLTFEFRFTNKPPGGVRDALRFGLFNGVPGGVVGSDPANYSLLDADEGYWASVSCGNTTADTGGNFIRKRINRASTNGGLYSTDENPGAWTFDSATIGHVIDSNRHTASLTLTRNPDGTVSMLSEMDGATIRNVTDDTALGGPDFTFNEVAIGHLDINIAAVTRTPKVDFIIDDVKISVATSPCPNPIFDANNDNHVDSTDFLAFAACALGPNVSIAGQGQTCKCMDKDNDDDLDLNDFARFQMCYSEAAVADPNCDN